MRRGVVHDVVDAMKTVTFEMPAAAAEWMRHGERGISSNSIFEAMTGVPAVGTWGHRPPSDPDDLRRCRLLLEAVPEFAARIGEMAIHGRGWERIAPIWPQLCATMDEEVPDWRDGGDGRAPRTYAMMKKAGA